MAFTAAQKREQRAAARKAAEETGVQAPNVRKPRAEKTPPTEAEQLNERQMKDPGSTPSATGKISRPSSAGGKVIVGCKIGVAYLDLQMQKKETVWENTQTGPREVSQFARVGMVVRIRGTAYPRGEVPEGFPDKPKMKDGAALTEGVDAEFMAHWLEQNKLNPIVVNHMVFVAGNEIDIAAIAAEHKGQMSGLEPIDPKGDPRSPRSTNASVSNIEPAKVPK